MKATALASVGVATAAAVGVAAAGVSNVTMAGPTPGLRISMLVPQAEVTALFLVGPALWARAFRTDRFDAFRHVLATTARGPRWALWTLLVRQITSFALVLAAGSAVWLFAAACPGGPSLVAVARSRLLLLAFGVFGSALGAWVSVALGGRPSATALAYGLVAAMAALPLAIAPVVSLVGARPAMIEFSMLASPWIVTAGASGLDILRTEWLYALSPLGSVEAPYPSMLVAVAAYGAVAVAMLVLAVRRLGAPRHRRH